MVADAKIGLDQTNKGWQISGFLNCMEGMLQCCSIICLVLEKRNLLLKVILSYTVTSKLIFYILCFL